MDTIFIGLGMITAFGLLWWTFGVLLFTFAKVYVVPGAPVSARVQAAIIAGFVYPIAFMVKGRLPCAIVGPVEPTPEQREAIEAFAKANCSCPSCRERRGE